MTTVARIFNALLEDITQIVLLALCGIFATLIAVCILAFVAHLIYGSAIAGWVMGEVFFK